MDMRKYLGTSILAVALLLASGVSCLAKDSRSLSLHRDIVLNGTTLPAGKYAVKWEAHSPQATVKFARHHKVVLTTECTLEDRGRKSTTDVVIYETTADGTTTATEIRFAGSSEALVFRQ